MSKIVLAKKPTFELPVTASRLGGEKLEFKVTYKAMALSEYRAFTESVATAEYLQKSDADVTLEVAEGWDLDRPFTQDGIQQANEDCPGLSARITKAFIEEYERVRWGN